MTATRPRKTKRKNVPLETAMAEMQASMRFFWMEQQKWAEAELDRDAYSMTEQGAPFTRREGRSVSIEIDGCNRVAAVNALDAAWNIVPLKFRDAARLNVSSEEYGVTYSLTWDRPETRAEAKERKQRAARHAARLEEEREAALAKLKADCEATFGKHIHLEPRS